MKKLLIGVIFLFWGIQALSTMVVANAGMLEDFEGSFEPCSYGDIPAGWATSGSSKVSYSQSKEAFEGGNSLHAQIGYDPTYYALIKRSFTGLNPGSTVNVQINVKCSTTSKCETGLGSQYVSQSGSKTTKTNTRYWYSSSSSDWTTMTVKDVLVASNGSLFIFLRMANSGGSSDVYWDNLVVTETAPPSTSTTTTSTTTTTTTTSTSTTTTTTLQTVPAEPTLWLQTSGTSVTISWSPVATATGYTLLFAPYPYTGPDSIENVDMGAQTGVSFNLWGGAAYYVAVQAYNGFGSSGYSNIEYFVIGSAISVNPTTLNIVVGETGTCTITGGVSPYNASSNKPSVATASVSGSILSVTGLSAGSATVLVSDSASDSTTVSAAVTGGTILPTYTNSLGQKFVLIPAGTFTMGSPDDELGRQSNEGPQHQVTLTQPFYMQTTEVTQAQWETVMGSNPSKFQGCPTCPVEQVSWNDAQAFIANLNAMGEGTYSLPTEAQWEYACRAVSTTAFYNGPITEPFGDDPNLDAIGWYSENSAQKTHPVAQKTPNAWGLYDMSGNAREWCQDWYGSYASGAVTDPIGPSTGSTRVLRGGGWPGNAEDCRSADRYGFIPGFVEDLIGFRLVLPPGQ